ncbi:hypothetical protein E5D57_012683 [Metarhizium anisopliae]|nr:hypothetical protein E5D57_012683 [Metarhizium anisopliae]
MFRVAMDGATEPVQVDSRQPSSITNTSSWTSLPAEIRQKILSQVSLPASGTGHKGLGSPKVARFTAVCREWQVFFETCTFRRLVLNPDSLGEFDAIVRRHDARLGYIRKLWLRVQLPRYECPDCDETEDEATQRCNNKIFTTCIRSLLGTLKLWDPVRHGGEGLALMLSASSPSDSEHRFRRCEIRDDYPFHYTEDLYSAPGMVFLHRVNIAGLFSRYFHRDRLPPWGDQHLKRVQGTPLRLERQRGERGRFISPCKSFPAVPIVRGLVMRRQFRRDIHVRALSWLLARSFVALEWLHLERTVSLEPQEEISFHQGFQLHLLPSLPKTLRRLSFTRWKIPKTERYYDVEQVGSRIPPHDQDFLPREMARLSQRLEQLCPPWQMDTAAFLRSLVQLRESPGMLESSLKHVILRCLLPSSQESRENFESLALLAANAALSLPQLQVMELWGTCLDGAESRAYIFRYARQDRRASIVWRSCQEAMVAQSRILRRWTDVAKKHSYSTLAYKFVPFAETNAEIFWSDGACVYQHLLLKDLLFDPITRVIVENEPYQWRGLSRQGDDALENLGTPNLLGGHL